MEPTLNIFTNFRIDCNERFLRMQDSLLSFKDINACRWILNIRGAYKNEAIKFIKEHIHENLFISSYESLDGWFADSRKLLHLINSDYVLYWIEDHINTVPVDKYIKILSEMRQSNSDYLFITFYNYYIQTGVFDELPKTKLDNISTFNMDIENMMQCLNKHLDHYLISAKAIFSTDLFKKLVLANDPIPIRWPIETPFDLEKKGSDIHWLPIRQSFPNYELFASIDDDIGYEKVSLQSRNLYPKREGRFSCIDEMSSKNKLNNNIEIFHHYSKNHGLLSARIIVPFIIETLNPKSVIDIGCGIGSWLKVYEENEVNEILGLDGEHVLSQLIIDKKKYIPCNLQNISNINISKTFDLVSCLEVAEHLPKNSANQLVGFLCSLGDKIIFSAAIPGQTRENHVNEQYLDYWVNLFKEHGFIFLDLFREKFWNNNKVEWWYRQNLFLVVKSSIVENFNTPKYNGNMYIHYELYDMYLKTFKTINKTNLR